MKPRTRKQYSWEQTISRLFHAVGLDSIKTKILVFALLATLIPSLTLARLSYLHNKQALTEKTNAELQNISSHTARETDLWLKERFYDVRVFSNSYEVSENLERVLGEGSTPDAEAHRRLEDYLTSVRERSTDFHDLLVVDPQARVVATSTRHDRDDVPLELGAIDSVRFPPEWLDRITREEAVLGDAYRDEALARPVMMIAVPIFSGTGRFLGAMAGQLNFLAIERIIRSFSIGDSGHVYLVHRDGAIVASSVIPTTALLETRLRPSSVVSLLAPEVGSVEYADYSGRQVVGTGSEVPQLNWALVAEVGTEEAYAQIAQMRDQTVMMVSGLLLGIGAIAYVFGLTIVRPLDRLTTGAATVAAGHLDVDLPVVSGGEVGYMTRVFNEMVTRLRHGREELERLAVTDALTGLKNRKSLDAKLASEIARGDRYENPFAVMMIDIDHFKKYNDTFGHPAGDEILGKIGVLFEQSLREVDYAARYGGEEFFALLPHTRLSGAADVAERIRTLAEETLVEPGKKKAPVTVSIGIAEFPTHGHTAAALVGAADAALYGAKQKGRNRVMGATTPAGKQGRQKASGSLGKQTRQTRKTRKTQKTTTSVITDFPATGPR